MYSIIDSCDETSGWHLPGLCNVKETALSFVADVSFGWQGKFGYNEPCRVKHPQMSHGVTSHCGLYCRTLPGEGVFLVRNMIGCIKAVVHYISVTSCLGLLHEAKTVFSSIVSTAGPNFRSAQINTFKYSVLCLMYFLSMMYNHFIKKSLLKVKFCTQSVGNNKLHPCTARMF